VAGVFKRPSDKARGKAGKWTAWWFGPDGRRRSRAAYTDKAASFELARRNEAEASLVRDGLLDAGALARRDADRRPVADHAEDYRRHLIAKGDCPKHCAATASAIVRLLADAGATVLSELTVDRVQGALGRLKAVRSARTANHAAGAVKAFARWLHDCGRLKEVPRGLLKLAPYPEKSDRKRVRRALTEAELARLLAAAESGGPFVASRPKKSRHLDVLLTGPDRAMLYRLAMATGFRAGELASLTPESFALDGPAPTITVPAAYSKRGKRSGRDDVQPIRRADADRFRAWLAGKPAGVPVLPVPTRTADMLRVDLAAAGIPATDAAGRVLDFHALRHSYITHLVRSGVNPKLVQTLARHSTITLTLDRYTSVESDDVRKALEGGADEVATQPPRHDSANAAPGMPPDAS
jgi:integrase